MLEEELEIVSLKTDFYRDGFFKIIVALVMVMLSIVLLLIVSLGIFVQKPPPVTFVVDKDWRILPPVPLDKPYLKTFDLLQWVSDVLPLAFTYDFVNYTNELKNLTPYFTPDGWAKFSELVTTYAGADSVGQAKLFINSYATGAPIIISEGVLNGKYIWWVQMPIKINYSSYQRHITTKVTFQMLVVRVSTLDNLSGVAIDNIKVAKE